MALDLHSGGVPPHRMGAAGMDEFRRLERLLALARLRVEDAAPHSPEWDAAIEAVQELEHLIRTASPQTERSP
jgi:hypothetical protein